MSPADRRGLLDRLHGGLVVSCQAPLGDPLHGPAFMTAMAQAAVLGGAVGIRANGVADVRAVRQAVDVPVVGLWKDGDEGVYITPTVRHALAVAGAGAHVVAVDATARPRPDGSTVAALIGALRRDGRCLVMADVATLDEGIAAAAAGADLVATTLSGYTTAREEPRASGPGSTPSGAGSPASPVASTMSGAGPTASGPDQAGPDLDLVAALAARVGAPVVAEGRIALPEQARAALDAGAWAVVVGGAITRPAHITARFVAAMRGHGRP